jgi:hypothetical protein
MGFGAWYPLFSHVPLCYWICGVPLFLCWPNRCFVVVYDFGRVLIIGYLWFWFVYLGDSIKMF